VVRTRTVSAGAAVVAVAAILLAPAAAVAATPDPTLYSFATSDGDEVWFGFATVSPADASLSFLPTNLNDLDFQATGTEVCGGTGFAVTLSGVDASTGMVTWSPETGDVVGSYGLWINPSVVPGEDVVVRGALDADARADCTFLGIVSYTVGDGPAVWVIASIDPGDGETTPLVEVPAVGAAGAGAIATDPLTQDLLLFTTTPSGHGIFVSTVDLVNKTVSTPVAMTGFTTAFGSTILPQGTDFDGTGTLWLVTTTPGSYVLTSVPSGASLTSTTPTSHGILPMSGPGAMVSYPIPLAAVVDAPASGGTQLAATGNPIAAGSGLAAFAAVLIGAGWVIHRRVSARRAAVRAS
jgi:hypothetical protein